MHDPFTLSFKIPSPYGWIREKITGKSDYNNLLEVWHEDPCRDGSDDSCGHFKRSRHGDKEILNKIIKRFEFDWDSYYKSGTGRNYPTGYFLSTGHPNYSCYAITLNLFFDAAFVYFKHNRKKTMKFIKDNLFEILLFAENPTDSLHDSITLKFETDITNLSKSARTDRIYRFASIIYGWILRNDKRNWYKHPKYHLFHWGWLQLNKEFIYDDSDRNKWFTEVITNSSDYKPIPPKKLIGYKIKFNKSIRKNEDDDSEQPYRRTLLSIPWPMCFTKFKIPFLDKIRRFLFSRCCKCGKRFSWKNIYNVISIHWDSPEEKWYQIGEKGIHHGNCDGVDCNVVTDIKSN